MFVLTLVARQNQVAALETQLGIDRTTRVIVPISISKRDTEAVVADDYGQHPIAPKQR